VPIVNKLTRTPDGDVVVLNLIRGTDGQAKALACEPVRQDDLIHMRHETWLQGLRKGKLSWDAASLVARYLPVRQASSRTILDGVILELDGQGQKVRRLFSSSCFDLTLRRALETPLRSGEVRLQDDIRYWLSCAPVAAVSDAAEPNGQPCVPTVCQQVRVLAPAWRPEAARLADYLDGSEQLLAAAAAPQPRSEQDCRLHLPVFVAANVWDQGRRFACRHGNLESAAIFTGRLMQDPESCEVFVVADACVEATHAQRRKYSVMFTDESWSEVHRVLNQRRCELNRPHEIILGSVHGHPFLPLTDKRGRASCSESASEPAYPKNTAGVSSDDVDWHRSVFAGQPWAFLVVWGRTARAAAVWRAYGLAGGTLVPRTIRILNT
jgi:hypothetical protein